MDSFSTFSSAPVALAPLDGSKSVSLLDELTCPNSDFDPQFWFDFELYEGEDGADAVWLEDGPGTADAPNASNASGSSPIAFYNASCPTDASFDALNAMFAPTSERGEDFPRHVTPAGASDLDAPYPYVSPADVCALPPPIVQDFSEFCQIEHSLELADPSPQLQDGFACSPSQDLVDSISEPLEVQLASLIALIAPQANDAAEERPRKRRRAAADVDSCAAPSKRARCGDAVPSARAPALGLPADSFSPPAPGVVPITSPAIAVTAVSPWPATSASIPPQPIAVSRKGGFRCTMTGCTVDLGPKDSTWRGHFRTVHHRDVCRDPKCVGDCTHACPCPLKKEDGSEEECTAEAMKVDSLGRHCLNVHLKLQHTCPVCNETKVQRYSACQRHILTCKGKR